MGPLEVLQIQGSVDRVRLASKEYATLPKAPGLKPPHQKV